MHIKPILSIQKTAMVTKEQVEKIIGERFEQFENGKVVGDAKNRALSLKLRSSQVSNPSQLVRGGGSSGDDQLSKDDIE